MVGPPLLSDILGWTSIGCWLFAQFPQVVENIRRQSCEGLALPFLLNWLLGDITNLIGCVLTHQLPFQTILASYFVSVDCMLFSQYFYYGSFFRSPKQPIELPYDPLPAHSPLSPPPHSPRRRTYSSEVADRHHYRELSNAAANLAIAAALAASEEELQQHDHEHVHPQSHSRVRSPISSSHSPEDPRLRRPVHRRSSTSITRSEAEEAEDEVEEVDEAALAALTESFHSELGHRKRFSWSQERHATAPSSTANASKNESRSRTRSAGRGTLTALSTIRPVSHLRVNTSESIIDPTSVRGRPRERQMIESPLEVIDLEGRGRDGSLSYSHTRTLSGTSRTRRDRKDSRASQRSVGLVFLGVWALFSIGSTNSRISSYTSVGKRSVGTVLSDSPGLYAADDITYGVLNDDASSELVVGRIFAWLCTTLYLTSRLPQIWKNYKRKSVEGLSMFLFVFAFLGNTFYVLSILTSPSMSEDFLLESTPYLLGSGGTLLFDVTIVIQSFLYRPRPHHHHHLSHSYPYHAEGLAHDVSKSQEAESRPLLDGAVERGPLSIETQEIHRRRETGTSGVEDDRHVS